MPIRMFLGLPAARLREATFARVGAIVGKQALIAAYEAWGRAAGRVHGIEQPADAEFRPVPVCQCRRPIRIDAEERLGVSPDDPDQHVGDDAAAHRPEKVAVSSDVGLTEDVEPERRFDVPAMASPTRSAVSGSAPIAPATDSPEGKLIARPRWRSPEASESRARRTGRTLANRPPRGRRWRRRPHPCHTRRLRDRVRAAARRRPPAPAGRGTSFLSGPRIRPAARRPGGEALGSGLERRASASR